MRKLAWFTVGFLAGIFPCACFYGAWILPAGLGLLTLAGVIAYFAKAKRLPRLAMYLSLGCALGVLWFAVYDNLFVLTPRIADGETGYVQIEASDYSVQTQYGTSVEGNVVLAGKSYRVKAYLKQNALLYPGDTVVGRFRFRLTTAGGLDDPTNHRTEGIFLLAYPVGDSVITHAEEIPIRYYPAVWRKALLDRITQVFPEDAEAFARALLMSDRSGIDYELNTAFKVSGISHIIAVSGLHVSILFGLIYTVTTKRRFLACILGIPALLLFAAVVGFTPSVNRACIMQSLMLIAMAADRDYDAKTALAFAVLVMVVANPMAILSVSLQLSAGAVLGILMFSQRISAYLLPEKRLKKGNRLLKRTLHWLVSSLSVTLSAMVFTTPLVAYYFGCVSLIGIVTNLLTLWVISFVFYGIMFCLAVSAVSVTVSAWLAAAIAFPIRYVLLIARSLSKLPMAAVYTVSIYVVIWLIGTYVMLTVFLLMKKKRPVLLACCIVLTLALSQLMAWTEPLLDRCRVTVLDVGQGQSILLQSDGKTFLVDCGGDSSEQAADLAAETLLSQGISRLDGIIVTHYDEDHADGLQYLLTRIRTDRLILPHISDEEQVGAKLSLLTDGSVQYIREDVSYQFEHTQLTVVGPYSYDAGNESSLCVLFQSGDCDILITGDRSTLGERVLLQTHMLPQLDLLIVGHHGSASSTGEALLAVTRPKTAVISVGEDNRYGHPSDEVLQRLAEIGCEVYRTDIHGTIIFRR